VSGAGWQARAASFAHAARGIRRLAREPNARIQLAIAAAVIALAAWLGLERREQALLALAIGLVLASEAANTALEVLADRVAPDDHPLVAAAKDVAAGGVLIASVAAAVVGLLVLGPPLLRRLF
jgi:diacylglycerol kinase (ATP)